MKKVSSVFLYFLWVHLSALIFFSFSRFLLFVLYQGGLSELSYDKTLLWKSFLMGLRFDNTVSCYVLLLPLILITFSSLFSFSKEKLYTGIHLFFCICYPLVFLIAIADIPYFLQFFRHLNASIWNWFDEPSFVLGMIFQEKSFLVFAILAAVIIACGCLVLRAIKRRWLANATLLKGSERWKTAALFLVCTGFCVLGIRGRTAQKSPIRIGTAYFCNDPFLNQLGLNPAFVLLRTTLDLATKGERRLTLMNHTEAVENMRGYLGLPVSESLSVARARVPEDAAVKRNVVVIMMESMAAHYMQNQRLTPFLNRLSKKSIYFPNTYSAGIHTMDGVAGTLFSQPAMMDLHPFKNFEITTHQSLPGELKKRGYQTYYFTTHDEQFDNIGGFLSANDVQHIIAEKDYPTSQIHSNLGCSDDFLFQNSIAYLRKAAQSGAPFFSAFLTASNHQPYIIPPYFVPTETEPSLQAVEFSDYALSRFFELAAKESWFKNTVFLLLGDHGKALNQNDYDVSLAYHHIPLLIYDPQKEVAERNAHIAGQIDVFPTVMGILNFPWENQTLGIDLLREKREQIAFSSDDAYCCLDSSYYYVHRFNGGESLYNYIEDNKKDVHSQLVGQTKEMDKYARSAIQTAYFLWNQEQSIARNKK